MKLTCLVVLFLGLVAASRPAGQLPPRVFISGQVVEAETGIPIEGAKVTLSNFLTRDVAEAPVQTTSTTTSIAGQFGVFPAQAGAGGILSTGGRFEVSVERAGYLKGGYGQRRPTGRGQFSTLAVGPGGVSGLRLELWPEATISGVVTDEAGKPLGPAQMLVGAVNLDGNAEPESGNSFYAHSADTDSAGRFTIRRLPPGQFIVALNLPRHTVWMEAGQKIGSTTAGKPAPSFVGNFGFGVRRPPLGPDGDVRTYIPLFYSQALDASDATAIDLRAGEQRTGVDFALRVVPGVQVAGKVIGFEGTLRRKAFLSLRRAADPPGDIGIAIARVVSSGEFTFADVPAGSYILYAHEEEDLGDSHVIAPCPRIFASVTQRIDVGPQGLADVTVALKAHASVRGRVTYEGTRSPSPGTVLLYGTGPNCGPYGGVVKEGSFEIDGIRPGRYAVTMMFYPCCVPQWLLKSARLGGKDVTTEYLQVDDSVEDLVITVTDQPAAISGEVRTVKQQLTSLGTVVAFPTNAALWNDAPPEAPRFGLVRATTGTYELKSLPPGEYYVAAVDDRMIGSFPNAGVLARIQARATKVTLRNGATQVIHLTMQSP